MHNNFFFLTRLVDELNTRLPGYTFGEIFSQSKDELIIGLYRENHDFYIKASLSPLFSCLSFPTAFSRAKKNSADLFPVLIDKKIMGLRIFENDRSFSIDTPGFSLIFKMYGNRSNVLLFEGDNCINIYKQKFSHDRELKKSGFAKKLDLSFDKFLAVEEDPGKFLPTLGKDLVGYFQSTLHEDCSPEEKWNRLLRFKEQLFKNPVCIIRDRPLPELSLIPKGTNIEEFSDPVHALNVFFNEYTRLFFLNREKESLLQQNWQNVKKAESYIQSAEAKLHELEHLRKYDQVANIIMANMHQIKKGAEEVELFDFYNNEQIKIKLKRELSPQKNAENLYRKAKNQKIETGKLRENIQAKKDEIDKHLKTIEALENAAELKHLKPFRSESKREEKHADTGYHKFTIDGFDILVGKNAKRNDELTFKVAGKNDLWLHAKDTPGSHVVIRQIPGKIPGDHVLEKAASLAAYYSKRKTEGLVPVSYTERKYVRKTKDLGPGQVIVEKEKVILAEPVNWTKTNN